MVPGCLTAITGGYSPPAHPPAPTPAPLSSGPRPVALLWPWDGVASLSSPRHTPVPSETQKIPYVLKMSSHLTQGSSCRQEAWPRGLGGRAFLPSLLQGSPRPPQVPCVVRGCLSTPDSFYLPQREDNCTKDEMSNI